MRGPVRLLPLVLQVLLTLALVSADQAHYMRNLPMCIQKPSAFSQAICADPVIADLIPNPIPNPPSIVAFLNDTVSGFRYEFSNSYPVVMFRSVDCKLQFPTLYSELKQFGLTSLPMDAATIIPERREYLFYATFPSGQLAIKTTAAGQPIKEGASIVRNISHDGILTDAARVEAAELGLTVYMTHDSRFRLGILEGSEWTSYEYGARDVHPTGLIEVKRDSKEVTYLVLFQSLYGFYKYDVPLQEVIKMDFGQRHFDARRLVSCPVYPCHDFRMDAALLSSRTQELIFFSGLHGYQYYSLSRNFRCVYDLAADLHVTGLRRLDAAFTAYDSDGEEYYFLIASKDVISFRASDYQQSTAWSAHPIKVSSLFQGFTLVDAALSFPDNSSGNVLWLFYEDTYSRFLIPAGDLSANGTLGPYTPDLTGSISDRWPALPLPLHAALPHTTRSQKFKARFIVDNWFFEVDLENASAPVKGPFLNQVRLYACDDMYYSGVSAFKLLGIDSRDSFRDYIEQFRPTASSTASAKTRRLVLTGLMALAGLIVFFSLAICCYMWFQSRREKARGFEGQSKRFHYDYS